MQKHECKESKTCTCYSLALEPKEDCPIHGSGPWPPRCEICGRFFIACFSEALDSDNDDTKINVKADDIFNMYLCPYIKKEYVRKL